MGRALGRWREQLLTKITTISAQPPRRNPYSVQVVQQSYAEILQYTAQPAPPIQNRDGTFIFMAGYDRI